MMLSPPTPPVRYEVGCCLWRLRTFVSRNGDSSVPDGLDEDPAVVLPCQGSGGSGGDSGGPAEGQQRVSCRGMLSASKLSKGRGTRLPKGCRASKSKGACILHIVWLVCDVRRSPPRSAEDVGLRQEGRRRRPHRMMALLKKIGDAGVLGSRMYGQEPP